MSIFSRARDIIAANVADLIDRADDPAKTIRVIIMEMEETLVEVRAAAARSIAEQKEKRRQVAVIEHLQASWTERAELALEKGREDLARGALIEKQKLQAMAGELQEENAAVIATLRESEGDIAKLQAKLREARSRQAAIATRIETAQHRVRMREMVAGERTEAAFANFALLERQADLAEGHAEALALAAPRSIEEEIAELRVAEQVDAELDAMKAARVAACPTHDQAARVAACPTHEQAARVAACPTHEQAARVAACPTHEQAARVAACLTDDREQRLIAAA